MSVANGFVIVVMLLLLAYMFYRLARTKNILLIIPAGFQMFSLVISIQSFVYNVESLQFVQATCILFGVLVPAVFLVRDYFHMTQNMKEQGVFNGLVEKKGKSGHNIYCLSTEGINKPAAEKQTNEILNELSGIPENLRKNIRKVINHANVLLSEGNQEEAYYIYSTVSRVVGVSYSLCYNLACICYRAGKYDEALENYKKALEQSEYKSAHLQDLYYNLGNTLFMLEKYERAARYYEKALELEPENNFAGENLAFAYVHMGERDKGIELFRKIGADKNDYRTHFIAGKLLCDASRYAEAEEEFRCCIALKPSDLEAREELGKLLARKNRFEDALRVYDEILDSEPDNYSALCGRAGLCGRLKRWNEAADAYRRAINLRSDNCKNYYNMAVALQECGKTEQAIAAYREAIKLNPAFSQAYNNLGIAFSSSGRTEEAIQIYEEGIKIDPKNFDLFFNFGMSLFEAGRFVEAVSAYRNALDINPDELEIYYYLGAALTELRRYNDAVEAYKCALKIKPSDAELHYNIAAIYAMLGRYDIAGENLKNAIALREDIRQDAIKNSAFDGMRAFFLT